MYIYLIIYLYICIYIYILYLYICINLANFLARTFDFVTCHSLIEHMCQEKCFLLSLSISQEDTFRFQQNEFGKRLYY